MATYSIAEAQERLPDLVRRAIRGEEIAISGPEEGTVAFRPVASPMPGPMAAYEIERLRRRAIRPRDPAWDGPAEVRRMRDEDWR